MDDERPNLTDYRNRAERAEQALAERDAEVVRLKVALERCRRIVEVNLHRQDEKVGDVVHVVNAALGGTDAQD